MSCRIRFCDVEEVAIDIERTREEIVQKTFEKNENGRRLFGRNKMRK